MNLKFSAATMRLWLTLRASLGNFRGRRKNCVGNLIGGGQLCRGPTVSPLAALPAGVGQRPQEARGPPKAAAVCLPIRAGKQATAGRWSRHALGKIPRGIA